MLAFSLLIFSAVAGIIVLLYFAARADRRRWERGQDVDRRIDALIEEREARAREHVPTCLRRSPLDVAYDDEHNVRAGAKVHVL